MRLWVMQRGDTGNINKGTLAGWGIDRRDPMADKRLVEYCLSIPTDQYLSNGVPRSLAKRALADRLPQAVLNERRKGYQAADWHEGLTAARADITAELDRLAVFSPAAKLLDIERMKRLVENWPASGWERDGRDTAISPGAFTRHFRRPLPAKSLRRQPITRSAHRGYDRPHVPRRPRARVPVRCRVLPLAAVAGARCVVRAAAAKVGGWSRVLWLAKRHRISGLVHAAIAETGIEIDRSVAEELASQTRLMARRNLLLAAETARLQGALEAAGIPAPAFKGVTLAQLAYGSLDIKDTRDIDLLVPPDRADAALEIPNAKATRSRIPPNT